MDAGSPRGRHEDQVGAQRRALLVVDLQNDFCEGGALGIEGGAACARRVAAFIREKSSAYAHVVVIQDWHIDPGDHFGDPPDMRDSWPPHCRAGTSGADLHPALGGDRKAMERVSERFRKGQYDAAYSGFLGVAEPDVELAPWLRERLVESVDCVGLVLSGCVAATARDAVAEGFRSRILIDLCADHVTDEEGLRAILGDLTRVQVTATASEAVPAPEPSA